METSILSLAGKTAWITGGTSGLGLAAARLFARHGARTALFARDAARGRRAAEEIGAEARFFALDVRDAAACDRVLGGALRDDGRPDVILHAAGVLVREDLPATTPASVAEVMGASLDGAVNVLRVALPDMERRRGGAIVLTSSYLAMRGGAGAMPIYNAAKAALLGLMKSLAVRYGPAGVRVNAVLPAFIETPLNRDVFDASADPEAKRRETAARFPLRRLGRPQDFAHAALFLASDASSWITGHGLVLDGGLTA
jgi:NAD(P)-dependent dehydrogenase (short-subunit alcohol dehydrogenase family)